MLDERVVRHQLRRHWGLDPAGALSPQPEAMNSLVWLLERHREEPLVVKAAGNRRRLESGLRVARMLERRGIVIPHWAPPTHAMQIWRYAEQGSIGLLWISATNPAVSLPELPRIRSILASEELFVVVQDAFLTETAHNADVVLPTAIWGEKAGTFTNTDRTVHLSERLRDAGGIQWPCNDQHPVQGRQPGRAGDPQGRPLPDAARAAVRGLPAAADHRPERVPLPHPHQDRAGPPARPGGAGRTGLDGASDGEPGGRPTSSPSPSGTRSASSPTTRSAPSGSPRGA